ncbi:hypothetical protein A6V39_02775 [Candidatus Mycoplasma haematobovis]|uniref:Uncharacterized protein n=1 Tax=Candidatus Mycoplasma haematobovis TaxID=432608 RepID=A0A1A9QDK9_9MOLU|nr:hypothetical protein [Candidatus Mycoplasma haematobovis]OAL10338.1 hypothetical protein A6V39_02775 [Candidatus Mycoplasma haematobovis]
MKFLLVDLAKKIYLSPTKHTIDDCISYLDQVDSDLNKLKSIDTEGVSPFVLKREFSLTPDKIEFSYKNKEDSALNSLTDSYEFTNIKDKTDI